MQPDEPKLIARYSRRPGCTALILVAPSVIIPIASVPDRNGLINHRHFAIADNGHGDHTMHVRSKAIPILVFVRLTEQVALTSVLAPANSGLAMNKKWTITEAKAKFGEVIDLARSQGPQAVTRNGRPAVVIVAADEWERRNKRRGNLSDIFAASPLRGSQLDVRRLKDRPRKVDL